MLGWLSTSVNGLYNTFSGRLHVTRDDNSEKMVLVLIIIEEICHKLVWIISSTRKLDRFWNRLGKLYRYWFVTFITVKERRGWYFFAFKYLSCTVLFCIYYWQRSLSIANLGGEALPPRLYGKVDVANWWELNSGRGIYILPRGRLDQRHTVKGRSLWRSLSML